jgi:hypothetical protein
MILDAAKFKAEIVQRKDTEKEENAKDYENEAGADHPHEIE